MPVLFFAMANALRTVLLNALRWLRPPDPPVAESHVPIEVIIPAFNEEEWIVETLEAIDAAAENYGAPVRVVMTDDGSTDRTNELAKETAANFRFATAEVLDGPHLGKSAALNTALFTCRADIVVRIDADTLVDRWCFYYMARWFQDPEIGQVEAMSIPRRGRSVFRKMRVFENLRRCGFAHRGAQTVDGVDVVPGYFTAFRREPAMRLGGFTRGMNGEDADLTLGFARLGYRTWLDEKVVVYEDVPPTYLGFREQRHRWNRSTFQVFARHSPLHAGVGNPKVWFYLTRQLTIRLTTPFRLVVVLYVFVYLIVEGSYQTKFFLLTGYIVIVLASAAVSLAMSVRFNALDRAGWIILWPFFVLLLYVFGLEALLSLPTRPAHLGPRRAEPVLAPVIH
jgi:cellulose synthase/poly-beta-1,6-N-acetylglucosamine synthase-like glycosyltransferase